MNNNLFDTKFKEFFGEWKKLDDDYRYVTSPEHNVIISEFHSDRAHTMVIRAGDERKFLADYKAKKPPFSTEEEYDIVDVTGSSNKEALDLFCDWIGIECFVAKPFTFTASRPTSIVLCNSAHPFAKHALTAKPVPMKSKPNLFYVLVGSEVVLIDKDADKLVLVSDIEALKVHLKEDKPFPNKWHDLDPANKYIANDIMKMMHA